MLTDSLRSLLESTARLFPAESILSYPFFIRSLVAVVLVCLVCGAVGSLVVGNRMAFFSDALAHCAFAGVALAFLVGLGLGAAKEGPFREWGILSIMVAFGIFVGVGIAYVKENTLLANDTVIGVFFAGAIGFGAMLFKALNVRSRFTPENFIFGDPTYVNEGNLLALIVLALATFAILMWIHNQHVFTSFNASLARSRQMSMRACNYVFIVLLALIVNLSITTVGALLINALLVVPAATAANVSRNMRQMFWLSILLSLAAGLLGAWLSISVGFRDPATGDVLQFGMAGTIVVISVAFFFLSMAAAPWLRGKQTA